MHLKQRKSSKKTQPKVKPNEGQKSSKSSECKAQAKEGVTKKEGLERQAEGAEREASSEDTEILLRIDHQNYYEEAGDKASLEGVDWSSGSDSTNERSTRIGDCGTKAKERNVERLFLNRKPIRTRFSSSEQPAR